MDWIGLGGWIRLMMITLRDVLIAEKKRRL
jgi:hypothetical protein